MRRRYTACALSERCLQRLNMYALAAGSAAVGVLAQAQGADAKVIYTPADHPILHDSHFSLDLNHDGKTDFEINQTQGCTSDRICQARLYAYVPFYHDRGNAVAGQGQWPFHALALQGGAVIGPAQPFGASALYFRSASVGSHGRVSGSWIDVTNRYLGLKFLIQGQVHFGWARLDVKPSGKAPVIARLTGYAYESEPGKPIVAGQTRDEGFSGGSELGLNRGFGASLAALALGAQGIPIWRRKDPPVAESRS